VLFYKRDIPYTSGETDDVQWIKPFMLPDVFNNMAVPNAMLAERPSNYTNYTAFLDDVDQGKYKPKKNKIFKKKKSEFVPKVELKLPPPKPKPVKEEKKKPAGRGQGNKGQGQSLRGHGGGQGRGSGSRGVGAVGDGYGGPRPYSGGDNIGPGNRRMFGRGVVSGKGYYGDNKDFYYAGHDYSYEYDHWGWGRPNPFRMSELQSALPHQDGDRNPRHKQHHRKNYQQV